jgi:hypothetical protein
MLYRFRLLRYAPNRLSEEFYNIAIVMSDAEGRMIDARFTPDFVRLRCNPLADLLFLEQLKAEFENRRLSGEGFSGYVEELMRNLSQGLQLSEEKSFLGEKAPEEMDRLAQAYLATPRRSEVRPIEPAAGTRRCILGQMRETFRLYHLSGRLRPDVPVGAYVSPRFTFHMDYAYEPNGTTHYLQALSLRHDVTDAGRLCFVFDRIRSRLPAELTAVVADALPQDTRELLASSQIRTWPVSKLDNLALAVRKELGL